MPSTTGFKTGMACHGPQVAMLALALAAAWGGSPAWAQSAAGGGAGPATVGPERPAGDGLLLTAPRVTFGLSPGEAEALRLQSAAMPTASSASLDMAGAVPGVLPQNPGLPVPSPDLGAGVAPLGAAAVPIGPFYVYPTLGASFGHTDNVERTRDGAGSSFWELSPRMAGVARLGSMVDVTAGWQSRILRYTDNERYNVDTHQFAVSAASRLSTRTDAQLATYVLRGADVRGAVDRAVLDPEKWTGLGLAGRFGYGAPSATGRLEFEAGLTDKRYDDDAVATTADVRTLRTAGRFLYRVTPRTQLLTEVIHTGFDYGPTVNRDSTETRLRVGATWAITSITSGSVRAGVVRKRFDDSRVADYSGADAEGSFVWTPRSTSVLALFASVRPNESTGADAYRLDRSFGASWTQQMGAQVFGRAFAASTHAKYPNLGRTDDLLSGGLSVGYAARRWLRLGAQWAVEDRSSTFDQFDYRRNVFSLTAEASL